MIKEVIKNAEEKMNKTVSVLEKDLSTMKAGRANPSMLDKIQIDYYGTMCPLSQVANVVTSIRKTANDKLKNMKKDADISEDEIKKAEDSVQKITDGVVKKIDSIITAKEKEVLSI